MKHVFECAYGGKILKVGAGRLFLPTKPEGDYTYCYQCFGWIIDENLENTCEGPNEPCHACNKVESK